MNKMQQASSENNDMPIHKFIPMETLDLIQPNQVKLLYYQNPSRFYVYLRQKINIHAQFQIELQRAMQNYQSLSLPGQYKRYQAVAAQDNHSVWHRATILDTNPDSTVIHVYFVDFGQEENISLTNIRPLPQEFVRQSAFAIPCRLYQIYPIKGNEQSTWKLNDLVHDEFNRLMGNMVSCKVCGIEDQKCYDVEIDIPKVGDLGRHLFEKNLVSHTKMRSSQPTTYNANQPPPGFPGLAPSIQQIQRLTEQNDHYNNTVQQSSTRVLQKPIVQQSPSTPTSTADSSSSDIKTFPPQDGNYIITQVYSATEFYGHSQGREKELDALHKVLESVYNNNNVNDQSLSVHFLMEGVACAIQQGDKYHRVIIKHRESESRVLVKLVDRGDEIIVDTSELLQLEKRYFTIQAFAQPFRLHNYDESHSTANITRKLKRLILNQRVHITQHLPVINGFYPVEVKLLPDNHSVNQILLSNDNPIIPPPVKPIEPQIPKLLPERTNEDLPAPQKLLTAPSSSRFTPNPPVANEQSSRFTRPEEYSSRTNGNTEQNRPYSRGFTNEEPRTNQRNENGNNRGGRNGFGNRNNDDNENTEQRPAGFNNRSGGFADRGDRSGFNNRNNDDNENTEQRPSGFNNRSGGFADRGGRSGFNNRNNDDNENTEQRPSGFNNRSGGFADRGNRSGYPDRNFENGATRSEGFASRGARGGGNRNNHDDDNEQQQRFDNRGGYRGENRNDRFPDNRDREDGGDNGGRRGGFNDRGGSRGGGRGNFSDRGSRGGDRGGRPNGFEDRGGRPGSFGDRGGRPGGFGDRGGRPGGFGDRGGRPGGFGDRSDSGFRSNSDNDTSKSFSGWSKTTPASNNFEAGDNIIENIIPKETFKFVISHIETPNDFFIQLISKGDELTELSETLQKEYKDAPELNTNSIKINQVCLAKSSDDCWYRAIVLSPGLIKIKVRFIDFGDTLDVEPKTIRQLAKKFCLKSPYAYHCMLKDVEANESFKTNEIIEKCAGQTFNGKIENKSSDNKYLLQSDNFEKLMIEINAIKKTNNQCVIVYIDADKHQFYIQDDDQTMDKISDEVRNSSDEVSSDDIQINSMVISTFDDAPYRALIQSDLNDDNVEVYFVDYGNTNICSKALLKKCNEQLKSYKHQAKRCQLYGISLNDLDDAFKQLNDYLESDKTTISIINQHENLYNVLVYIDGECFNDKFRHNTSVDMDDQSSIITTTTVKEQERSTKRNNEEILSPVGNSLSASMNHKRQKSESETEANSTKTHQGILTYIDKTKPSVYLQLSTESVPNLERINDLIDGIVQEDKHNSSYEIGDYVIAQFTDDKNHYRARIDSYSDASQTYTVYFLDYGNIDENVSLNNLYSYSEELKQIEPQAHCYSLEKITSQSWIDTVQSLFEQKMNDEIEFYFIDENKSLIHIKLDNENEIYTNQPKTFSANISGTNKDCFYIHILPDADALICEMDELLNNHTKENNTSNSWKINDLCIVFSEDENKYFRGKILLINNEKYNVQCIDYGNILSDITNDNLYLLTDEKLLKRSPLARECRLHGVNDNNQIKAIEEVIQHIEPDECVTITVENDQNDQCMFVMLFRGDNEIINDRYQSNDEIKEDTDFNKKDDNVLPNSFDSAIAADDESSNGDIASATNDQQLTSPIGTPQAESTHQYGDTNATVSNSSPSTTSMTINQTIDFGENDPATSNSTIKDDTENENL